MSSGGDSIYADLLRTRLEKLGSLQTRRDLLAVFAALEHFRRDLHAQEDLPGILAVTHRYIAGLNLFQIVGFFLVNPVDRGFDLAWCNPACEGAHLGEVVNTRIRTGQFAAALRQASPVFYQLDPPGNERGVLHSMAVTNQVMGVFCGLLQPRLGADGEVAFSLLSLLLGASADALANSNRTARLASEVKALSGLLPICAWCKKVRDDRGYWAQIEAFIQTHSDASFSHGICPECERRFLAGVSMPEL